jgi:hypothetical protein
MSEKGFVSGTQVIEPGFAVGSVEEAVLGTLAMTGEPDLAFPAVAGQRVALVPTKLNLLRGCKQLDKVSLSNVAELILRLHEVVAGIEVTVVL